MADQEAKGLEGAERGPAASADSLKPYALIVESMTEGVSLAAEDGTIVYTNPAEDSMFGYGPGELVGCHVSVQNAYPPEENQRRVEEVIARLKIAGAWEGEWLNRRKDGTAFVTASRITSVSLNGRTHWLCVQRDVTAQLAAEAALRRSEEALRESAARLDLAVTAHGIGIFDWDIRTNKLLWTRQEEELFGFPPGSFGGDLSDWAARVLPEDLDAMNATMGAAMSEQREHLDFAFRIRRPDGEVRWIEGSSRFLYAKDGTPLRMVGTNMDVTERRRAEEHQRLLVNELNHRVKNTLAIIQGIAQQSFKGVEMPEEVRHRFEARLAALSAAHDVLTRESWETASIVQIIEDAVRPYAGQPGRVVVDGPDLRLQPKTAVSLALAIHELGTNAAKYGALSGAAGKVEIRWTEEHGRLALTWAESGGPLVDPPTKRGFGTRMIERALAAELRGNVRIDFRSEGVVCTVDALIEKPSE